MEAVTADEKIQTDRDDFDVQVWTVKWTRLSNATCVRRVVYTVLVY